MKYFSLLSILIASLFLTACDSGPKVIEAVPQPGESSAHTGNSQASRDVAQPPAATNAEHKVVVEEVLEADKYTYLHVSENGQSFWVAVSKMPVAMGETYYFKGGLLKKNFYSREHDRVFETVYLVSDIRKQPLASASGGSAVDQALNRLKGNNAPVNVSPVNTQATPAEGTIKLSELFANKDQYNGQKVRVSGKCVKVNPNIMGRNWAHIQDDSGKEFDLTVTSSENIPVGHVVSLEGTIALNKDFGAGYHYDIIMEGATILK